MAARKCKGMSMQELARKAKVSVPYIYKAEHDQLAEPRVTAIGKVAEALGVQPGWLAFGDGGDPYEKHAVWKLEVETPGKCNTYRCSRCGRIQEFRPWIKVRYCWYCGAKMERSEEDGGLN